MRPLEYLYRKQKIDRVVPQRSRHAEGELPSHQKAVGDQEEFPVVRTPATQGVTPNDRTPR